MVLLDGSVSYFKIVAKARTVILGERFSCGHVGGNRIVVEKMCLTSYLTLSYVGNILYNKQQHAAAAPPSQIL